MPWTALFGIPWLVFLIVWIASAFFTRTTVKHESAAARASYAAPLVLGCLLLFSPPFAISCPWLQLQLWPTSDLLRAVCLLLCCAGVAFCFWARATLGNLWSGNITLKEDHHLITSGPYALARHPIYTGLSASFLATAVALGTVRAMLGFALAAGSFVYKLGREERLMAQHFPEEHAAWRTRVKRLIPFVW